MGFTKEQILLAELEIKSLLTRERYYRDTGQWIKLRDSWHPDVSSTLLRVSWFEGHIDSFVAASKKMAEGGTVAVHTINPVEIHFSPCFQKAVSESTGNISMRFRLDDGARYELVSWTRFISKLEMVGQGWKLVALEPIYERDTISPAVPLPVSASRNKPTFTKGNRDSYSSLAWLLDRRGFNVAMNLAGIDRPETVEELMRRQFEWLSG